MGKSENILWKWDKWQLEVLEHKGSGCLRCGRQVGKSTVVGKRRANLMLEFVGSTSLIIAPAQRQSGELFSKVLFWLGLKNEEVLAAAGGWVDIPSLSSRANFEARRRWEFEHGIFNEEPTKTTIVLKRDFGLRGGRDNIGSVCYCLPAGKTGVYLRCYALDFLDIDEAAFVPQCVYTALKPMLAVSQKLRGLGWEFFLSTPFGKGGFFYDAFTDSDFRQWHVSSEDCPRISKSFLLKEKKRMSKAEYAQEWQGEFAEEWNQFFSSDLLRRQMTFIEWNKEQRVVGSGFYLGVDVARYGGDECAFVIVELTGDCDNTHLRAVKCFTTERKSIPDTVERVRTLDVEYNFKRIFIDDSGVGGGVTDYLQNALGRRVVGLNNASKRVLVDEDDKDEKRRGILKEDLYSNVLALLETGKLELISDLSLLRSMKSITYEYSTKIAGRVTIFGDYSHLCEALVRACWCVRERGLDIYVY